MFQQKIATGD